MPKKSQLIDIISQASDRFGDKLMEFMDRYNLSCLADATVEQLEEYVKGMKE